MHTPVNEYRYAVMPGMDTVLGHLCTAAMGDSFAAGTTDGPGMFDFTIRHTGI